MDDLRSVLSAILPVVSRSYSAGRVLGWRPPRQLSHPRERGYREGRITRRHLRPRRLSRSPAPGRPGSGADPPAESTAFNSRLSQYSSAPGAQPALPRALSPRNRPDPAQAQTRRTDAAPGTGSDRERTLCIATGLHDRSPPAIAPESAPRPRSPSAEGHGDLPVCMPG